MEPPTSPDDLARLRTLAEALVEEHLRAADELEGAARAVQRRLEDIARSSRLLPDDRDASVSQHEQAVRAAARARRRAARYALLAEALTRTEVESNPIRIRIAEMQAKDREKRSSLARLERDRTRLEATIELRKAAVARLTEWQARRAALAKEPPG